ncbi:MAG: hypothetical protein ACLQVF_45265 [Isosphaeraceae bacterium]
MKRTILNHCIVPASPGTGKPLCDPNPSGPHAARVAGTLGSYINTCGEADRADDRAGGADAVPSPSFTPGGPIGMPGFGGRRGLLRFANPTMAGQIT